MPTEQNPRRRGCGYDSLENLLDGVAIQEGSTGPGPEEGTRATQTLDGSSLGEFPAEWQIRWVLVSNAP